MDLRQIKTQTSGLRDCMPSPVRWALPHIMFFESHTLTADPYLLCVRSFCSRKQGVSSCGESVGSLAGKPRWGCILPTLGGKKYKKLIILSCMHIQRVPERVSARSHSSGWPEAPAKEKKLAQQDNLKMTTRFLPPITSGQTQKLFWRTSSLLWEDKKKIQTDWYDREKSPTPEFQSYS